MGPADAGHLQQVLQALYTAQQRRAVSHKGPYPHANAASDWIRGDQRRYWDELVEAEAKDKNNKKEEQSIEAWKLVDMQSGKEAAQS